MIELLAKIFIKDYKNYSDSRVRSKYGELCGIFGIFLNILLFTLKFVFGLIASSVSMIGDAFNNLSDVASSLVQLIGFKFSVKKPDKRHPFGHGRYEYIAGLAISFLILYLGIELIKSSIKSFNNSVSVKNNIVSIVVLCISILIKFYIYLNNHRTAKKINSVTLEATAKDSLSDMISTSVVIISFVCSFFTTLPVDSIAGIIVGLFILKTGYESARDTIDPLIGIAPSHEFVEEVEKEVLRHSPIVGVHDLIIHDYGAERKMICMDVEVPGNMNIFELHHAIDSAEKDVSQKFNCSTVIHMDPVDVNDLQLNDFKDLLYKEVPKINPNLKVHDVRRAFCKNAPTLIFEVERPFQLEIDDEQLVKNLKEIIARKNPAVNCSITIDLPFV